MEVVSSLPRPPDAAAFDKLVRAQRILCSKCVDEDDCNTAVALLEELAAPCIDGGSDYFHANLTLASLHSAGFEPAIEKNEGKAAMYYLRLLSNSRAAAEVAADVATDAATQLCTIVRSGNATSVLSESSLAELEILAEGQGAGKLGTVSTWCRLAAADLRQQIAEAKEDPAVRERRLAREKARAQAREEEIARQRKVASDALTAAEALRHQGNDLCRQGRLPGNAHARQLLLRAVQLYSEAADSLTCCLSDLSLVPDEATEVRRQRGLLNSNSAQVQLEREDWDEVRRLAEVALQDLEEENLLRMKSQYRLAKAHVGLKDWEEAAKAVDTALVDASSLKGDDADALRLELWKLAEEISKALPKWKWSCAKPVHRKEEDFELRIIGKWTYPGGMYEIKLEPWGALIFAEETVKIDLMRKGLLRWRGEVEMISGMVLNISYEPGADVLMTEFIPPPDTPIGDQYHGPKSFTAHRKIEPKANARPASPPPAPPSTQEDAGAVPHKSAKEAQPPIGNDPLAAATQYVPELQQASPLEGVPDALLVEGCGGVAGRYELDADTVLNERPVYRRAGVSSAGEHYFWYRGGNWGVTTSLLASSLAAPFLVRCADQSGRSRHPLDIRRPRWLVRKGRGQEEPDPAVVVKDAAAGSSRVLEPAKTKASAKVIEPESSPDSRSCAHEDDSVVPAAIELRGRSRSHEEVNGTYKLMDSRWAGKPAYAQVGSEHMPEAFFIFFSGGYWVLARELCAMPKAIARRAAAPESRHPLVTTGASRRELAWEFLHDESSLGHMVTVETRTYAPDRAVSVHVAESQQGPQVQQEQLSLAAVPTPPVAAEPSKGPPVPSQSPSAAAGNGVVMKPIGGEARPAWVSTAVADLTGGEVRAAVIVNQGVPVSFQDMGIDVNSRHLKVMLEGYQTLELPLPAEVDVETVPQARWSDRTKTLKVRLAALG